MRISDACRHHAACTAGDAGMFYYTTEKRNFHTPSDYVVNSCLQRMRVASPVMSRGYTMGGRQINAN